MVDKVCSFYNYAIMKIQMLVGTYYVFYRRPDILDYDAKLLKKNKFFCNDIENMSN